MPGKTIAILATLDTKGEEAQYLRNQIESQGDTALIVDTGVVGQPAAKADVTREEVAEAGGTPLANLLEKPSREEAARRVNVPYAIDAEMHEGSPRPAHIKDRVRALGPTVRPDLTLKPTDPEIGKWVI